MPLAKKLKNKKTIWVLIIYFIFILTGIPWYWPENNNLIVAGFPAWVFVAILVSFFTSVFTAFLLLKFPWKIEAEDE